jgi:3-oxoacyl-[acyl-carrier-protein] synthase-1
MNRSVHIVALAARTPVGLTPETAAAAVRAGISRIEEHPFLVDSHGEPLRVACVPMLDPALLGWPRILALGQSAMRQLGERLAATNFARVGRVSVLLGLPELRPGWTAQDVAPLLTELARFGLPGSPTILIEEVARGHAATLEGLRIGSERIRAGALDCCIVGGVDSYLDAETLGWLSTHRQLKTEKSRASFFPGEAAGFLVLAGGDVVRGLALTSLAVLSGVGSAHEQALIKTDDITVGRGLATAISDACASTAQSGERIDEVYCDINGERYRSEEWGMALLHVQNYLVDGTAYHLPASSWGDVGAASGTMFVTLAARAWSRGYARGSSALAWSGSESGLRAAVVIRKPNEGRM